MDPFDETIDHLRTLLVTGERLPLIDEVAARLSDETLARISSLEPKDDLAELRADLEDPSSDFATRMVLLAVAYDVAAWDPDDPIQSESVDLHRAAFPRLAAVVAHDVPGQPECLRWVFVAVCVARAWDLAHVLLLRLLEERQVARAERELILARFRAAQAIALTSTSSEPHHDPAAWDPWPASSDGQRQREVLRDFLLASCLFGDAAWTEDGRAALIEAGRAFERSGAADLRLAEQSVRAVAALLEGRSARAAEQLDDLARRWPQSHPLLGDLAPSVWLKAAAAWADAKEPARAQESLATCAGRFPKVRGVWKASADFHASQAKFDAAYECLLREAALDAEFGNDPRMRVALALGPIAFERANVQAMSRDYLARNVGFRSSLERLIRVHWRGLSRLENDERDTWVVAAFDLWAPGAEENAARVHAAAAVRGCSVVLESVLKRRLFVPFRAEWSQRAHTGEGAVDEDVSFARFLGGQDKLPLGSMCALLQPCSLPEDRARGAFSKWVKKHVPAESLGFLGRELSSANITRQGVMHTPRAMNPEDAERHYELCQRLIDAAV